MTQISPEDVSEHIDDWVCRLNELYDQLDRWLASIPHDRIERGTTKQVIEPLMRQNRVAPRAVPTYAIIRGNRRMQFVPSALWAPGTNGRVNIMAGLKQHILVDRGDPEHGTKWQLVVDDFKRPLVPFTRTRLQQLLGDRGE